MSARWVVGVDIGGTNLVAGVVPAGGGLPVALRSRPTLPDAGGDRAVAAIAEMAGEVVTEVLDREGGSRDDVLGVGIGCPGPLDPQTGCIVRTPNLPWDGYPIRSRVSEALGLPAVLDNDANCAAYGEWWQGAGQGSAVLVGVTMGTGIGGGIVIDGKLLRGVSGGAGEIGHMTVQMDGRLCGCGNRGCLEAYASGPGIAARAREGVAEGRDSILLELVEGDAAMITAETVSRAVLRDDPWALEVVSDTARILGAGLAGLVNVLNPDVIVIVGGVTRAGESLLGPLREEIRRRAFPTLAEACVVVPGALADTAGVIGAAGLFLEGGWWRSE